MEPVGNSAASTGRRDFLRKALAALIGLVVTLVPFGAGLMVFLDPPRRKTAASPPRMITSLDALPNDGIPRKFAVLATRVDAWSKSAETPIGAVYLRRTPDDKLQAFNAA